jgi:uncharacterized membrane protein HdeD (DUF308 family)
MLQDTVRAAYGRTQWSLIFRGLLGIAIGIYILARPLRSIAAFALVIALWALIDGIANIAHAFALRGIVRHWGSVLLLGIISVLFGGAALYYFPALSLALAVTWVALWLILGGATMVYIATRERRLGMSWGWTAAIGVFSIVAGVIGYTYPAITLVTLMGLIAAFAILAGVSMLAAAARLGSTRRGIEALRQDVSESQGEDTTPADRGGTPGSRAACAAARAVPACASPIGPWSGGCE